LFHLRFVSLRFCYSFISLIMLVFFFLGFVVTLFVSLICQAIACVLSIVNPLRTILPLPETITSLFLGIWIML
jgi:hypothetical protein